MSHPRPLTAQDARGVVVVVVCERCASLGGSGVFTFAPLLHGDRQMIWGWRVMRVHEIVREERHYQPGLQKYNSFFHFSASSELADDVLAE